MEWCSPELLAEGEHAAAWAAETLAAAGIGADALYLATPDCGAREALAFWAAAHDTGFAFAAPGAFPWTLANSAAGRISQRLGIRGPVTTFVGSDEALDEALAHAADDLAAGVVTRPLVVRIAGDRPVGADGGPVRLRLRALQPRQAFSRVNVRVPTTMPITATATAATSPSQTASAP